MSNNDVRTLRTFADQDQKSKGLIYFLAWSCSGKMGRGTQERRSRRLHLFVHERILTARPVCSTATSTDVRTVVYVRRVVLRRMKRDSTAVVLGHGTPRLGLDSDDPENPRNLQSLIADDFIT